MKKLLLLLTTLALLSSCRFNGSHNGDLDGFWMLTQIDTLSNQHSVTCREQLLFWSFQSNLMKTQQLNENFDKTIYLYRFCHEGNLLEVFEPHEYERMTGNIPIHTDRLGEISRFGINALDEQFVVEQLNSKKMILKAESLRLHFEKY